MQLLAADRQPSRTAWGDTPPVAILASETLTKQHPDYAAAKTGDIEAAMSLIDELMGRRGALRRVSMLVRRLSPTIVPVHAVESNSINVIPSALAQYIGGAFDLSVEYSILQANRVSHTGSSGYHRLATPPLFAGNVEPGDYLIVDDFVGQGGTLANIRGHIQAQGGHVVGLVTLTGKKRSATLAGESQTLQDLRAQHAALEDWWSEVFGYGFALLTESEARYLLNSPDVDTIRARIAEIAREGDGRPG